MGCGYKYLNGGPGAPAFVWANPKHVNVVEQPLSGWWAHAQPFDFASGFSPAPGIMRYQCGTPPILSMRALETGVLSLLAAHSDAAQVMTALRAKSLRLTDLFIELVESRCGEFDFRLETPREHERRGSHVSLSRAEGAYAIVQALIARGVIGDFRAGDGKTQSDILRFGWTPLYLRFVDVWDAVEQLRQVMLGDEWRTQQFAQRHAVT